MDQRESTTSDEKLEALEARVKQLEEAVAHRDATDKEARAKILETFGWVIQMAIGTSQKADAVDEAIRTGQTLQALYADSLATMKHRGQQQSVSEVLQDLK